MLVKDGGCRSGVRSFSHRSPRRDWMLLWNDILSLFSAFPRRLLNRSELRYSLSSGEGWKVRMGSGSGSGLDRRERPERMALTNEKVSAGARRATRHGLNGRA